MKIKWYIWFWAWTASLAFIGWWAFPQSSPSHQIYLVYVLVISWMVGNVVKAKKWDEFRGIGRDFSRNIMGTSDNRERKSRRREERTHQREVNDGGEG
jgi:hypothetical protein